MAFDLSERFPKAKQKCQVPDSGLYQNISSPFIKPNKVAFLSRSPKKTQISFKIWTHAIYNSDIRPKIQNCTSISSKIPRFTYENLTEEYIQPLFCQCDVENTCKCSIEEEKFNQVEEITCHAGIRRRLFKGPATDYVSRKGFSNYDDPLRRDSEGRSLEQKIKNHPTFYNASVVESNAFYRGCKWSKWTSQRNDFATTINQNPGPADYEINKKSPSYEVICAEKLRAQKRKTSRQLRFIEKVQRQNILDDFPGPVSYDPGFPKGTCLKFIGPKAERFVFSKSDNYPNPTTYFIKRDFDVNKPNYKQCHASLPSRAPFTTKAPRFKYPPEEGPSPNSYNLNNRISCSLRNQFCNKAPFGSCSKRFTDGCGKEIQNDGSIYMKQDSATSSNKEKNLSTWEFRSKTIRMQPIPKIAMGLPSIKLPLPRDSTREVKQRLPQFQYMCPFFSSEARFRNWFNWISIKGEEITPGPAYYNLENEKYLHIFKSGRINRTERFSSHFSQTPAPNAYNVEIGIDNVLTTYNERLKNNVKNTHKYPQKESTEERKITLEEQEMILLNKSIALLNVPDIFEPIKPEIKKKTPTVSEIKKRKPKLLRCFIYEKKVKRYF